MTTDQTLSTAEFAAAIGVQPSTVRVRLCKTGSYYGVRPKKMPNRLLRWPANSVQRLMGDHTAPDVVQPAAK